MKVHVRTTAEKEGFRGCFFHAETDTERAMIVLCGDDGDDFMNKAFAGWLTQVQNCHALCIAVRQHQEDDTGVHSWPLECVEAGVKWLRARGAVKVGVIGLSMQAAMALSAASRIPEITLTIALSPCDFVPWGFHQGKIAGAAKGEWPSGGSAFSWRGEDLPFQPSGLRKEAYWDFFCREKQKYHENHSISLFTYSENLEPLTEERMIPAESICGKLVLVGAEDDSMWNSSQYIRRMKTRLEEKGTEARVEAWIYPYGTHLLVPEQLLKKAVPVGGGLISRMFASGKQHPKECRTARLDLEEKLTAVIDSW